MLLLRHWQFISIITMLQRNNILDAGICKSRWDFCEHQEDLLFIFLLLIWLVCCGPPVPSELISSLLNFITLHLLNICWRYSNICYPCSLYPSLLLLKPRSTIVGASTSAPPTHILFSFSSPQTPLFHFQDLFISHPLLPFYFKHLTVTVDFKCL